MADRKPDKTKLIVRPKPGSASRSSNVKPIQTSRTIGPRNAFRAKIEALLAELACEQLLRVWQQVCPFAIVSEFGLPDRRGIIQDLADFAEVLQPSLEDMTANQLSRRVERYAGATNRATNRPSLRPKVLRVTMPAPYERTRASAPSLAAARTPH